MRYDLLLRRASGTTTYLGRADDKTHAREWAKQRLRRDDIHFGDKVEVIDPREPDAPTLTIE